MIKETIRMIIRDEELEGINECRIDDWSGILYIVPRNKIKILKNLEYIKNGCVYILFGENEKTDKLAYIGESEDMLTRVNDHNYKKDWWNHIFIFTTNDGSISKNHIEYLEYVLFEKATKVGRYVLDYNKQTPQEKPITEIEKERANKYLKKIYIIMEALNYKIFTEIITKEEKKQNDLSNEILYLYSGAKSKKKVVATGKLTDDGFVIFKGSEIVSGPKDGLGKSNLANYQKHIVSSDIKNNKFINDHLVSSPTFAAVLIKGSNINGRVDWVNKEGKTLKEIQESML